MIARKIPTARVSDIYTLILAELKDPVKEKIERYGLYDTIERRHFYPTIEVAVEAFYQEVQPKT